MDAVLGAATWHEGDPRQEPLVIDGEAERVSIFYVHRAFVFNSERPALVVTLTPFPPGFVLSFDAAATLPAVAIWTEREAA